MSDRAPPVEGQGPREPSNPPVAKTRSRGTRGVRSSQRKRAAWQRFVFVDSLESNSGANIDPSHVPFRTDGSSRAYRFLAPEVAPEYTDIVQVESTPEPVQSASASSSSRPVIKPAAKKILAQEIPVRLGPAILKAGAIAIPQYQHLGKRPPISGARRP